MVSFSPVVPARDNLDINIDEPSPDVKGVGQHHSASIGDGTELDSPGADGGNDAELLVATLAENA